MLYTIIFKNIFVRYNKMLIMLLSIVVGASIVFSFSAIYLDISAKMSKELRTYGANFFVAPKDTTQKGFPYNEYKNLLSVIPQEKLVAQTPELFGLVRLDLANAILAGVNFSQMKKLHPFWQIEGEFIGIDFDEKNCMVGINLAKQMELKIDSKVNILSKSTQEKFTVRVKGIIDSGDASDNQIFVNLNLAQKILDTNKINYAKLSIAENETNINKIAKNINKKFPSLNAQPIRKISQSEGKILDKIKSLMALVSLLILIITTLCVNATLIAMVSERKREIALQKALGATNKSIIKQFFIENSIISFIGIVIGCIFGYILAQFMAKAVFGSYVDIRFWVIPLTFIISYVATIVASIFPIKKSLEIFPAIVLRGE